MFNKIRGKKGVYIYLKPEDYDELKKIADKEGLAMASWVRYKLLQFLTGRAFNED